MTQYKKLFGKSEIEYITPFLKLWMSFNNWYKKDLEDVKVKCLDKNRDIKKNADGTDKEKSLKTDREAINEYKKEGYIKKNFIKLLNGKSLKDEKFQNVLADFIKYIYEYKNKNLMYSENMFYKNPKTEEIENEGLEYISFNNKEYFISSGDEERLFSETLENVYQIRCNLVHGEFDIDNLLFINLVEKSYLILYPIMDKIFANKEEKLQKQSFSNKNYFDNVGEEIIYLLSQKNKPMINILKLFTTSIDYKANIKDFIIFQSCLYEPIIGKTINEYKKEIGVLDIFDSLSIDDKNKIEKKVIEILLLAKKKSDNHIIMTMNDWKKEFEKINFKENNK